MFTQMGLMFQNELRDAYVLQASFHVGRQPGGLGAQ